MNEARVAQLLRRCDRIHRSLRSQFKHALVWGASAKHQPQRCGLAHTLMDEDIVQIVKKV